MEKLMSTVTAITNIHELSPSPKGGNTQATLETQYRRSVRAVSLFLRRYDQTNLNIYLFHQNLMSMPVAVSLGMV
ncbi:hypothetical protein [Klebsiella pneumoniae]|uniref:hypothetical protein n=1 Tax=Klebsiella pneumoniae TaxID=573 RepID=UPI001E61BE44|nr:hypothetical protein [Klebsiella pneumoniae]